MGLNLKSLLYYYNSCIVFGKDRAQKVGWENQEYQEKGFARAARLLTGKEPQILDIGAGLGDFYHYLKSHGISPIYRGIDINFNYVEVCQNNGLCVSFQDVLDVQDNHEYAFALGTFHYLNEHTEDIQSLLSCYIKHVYEHVEKLFAFTLLKKAPEPFYTWNRKEVEDLLVNYEEVEIMEYPDDFFIVLYKKPQKR